VERYTSLTAHLRNGGPLYREFDGIIVPTKRRVYALNEDGTANRDLLLVTIDLDGIAFE
jgi:hypothetical protein